MNLNQIQKDNMRTSKEHRLIHPGQAAILDWTLGLSGEAGEVADLIKHSIFHQEPFDQAEVAKELGDVLWYIMALANELEIPIEVIIKLNQAKLAARYKKGFTAEESANRKVTEFSINGTFEELMKEATKEEVHENGLEIL